MEHTPEAKRADLNASASSIQSSIFNSSRRRSTLSNAVKLRDNIKVAVRCRPLLKSDKGGLQTRIQMNTKDNWVEVQGEHKKKKKTKYTFDFVYPENTTQEDLFDTSIAPIIDDVIQGFSCTVFAYGQTGTGKTFTMEGSKGEPGVIARSVLLLFNKLSTDLGFLESTISVSHLEIYNEELCDLLNDSDSQKLSIYRDKTAPVKNLTQIVVTTADEIFKILHQSLQKRRKGASTLNKESSRSHCIFTITILMKEAGLNSKDLYKIGMLNLVDLAGSECVGKGATTLERSRETKNINRSLLTLGMVICALVERKSYVPFRDSKLTRLLRESLGGRNKTLLIATISPSSSPDILLNTLHYAHKAKKIENKPEINAKMTEKEVVKNLLLQIQRLKHDLTAQRRKDGIYLNRQSYEKILKTNEKQKAKIKDLEMEHDLLLDQYHSQGSALSMARKELDITKGDLLRCREENKNVLSKANALESTEKELRDLLQKTISERDKLMEKIDRFESLQQENSTSVQTKTKVIRKLHTDLHDETKTAVSNESKRIVGLASKAELIAANAILASKMRKSTVEKRTEGMDLLFNEMEEIEEMIEQGGEDFITSAQQLSSSHQDHLLQLQEKIAKDKQNQISKLKLMQQVAENFNKDINALKDLIELENETLNQYPLVINQFKSRIQGECTKARTAAKERTLNLKMKLNETRNRTEAHQKSEVEFVTQAHDSLVGMQDATTKLKLADENFEELINEHKTRLQKVDGVVLEGSNLQKYKRTHETPLKHNLVSELPPEVSPLRRQHLTRPVIRMNTSLCSTNVKRHRDDQHFRKPKKRKKFEAINFE